MNNNAQNKSIQHSDNSISLLSTVALLLSALGFKDSLSHIYAWDNVTVFHTLIVISLIMTFLTLLYLMAEWQRNSLFEGMFGRHINRFIWFLNTCRMLVVMSVVSFVLIALLLNFLMVPPITNIFAVFIAYILVPVAGYYLGKGVLYFFEKIYIEYRKKV